MLIFCQHAVMRYRNAALLFILIIMVCIRPSMAGASPAVNIPPDKPDMLQFSSGGHVLGFSAGAFMAAGADHALRVEHVGARRIHPQASNSASTLSKELLSLDTVTYPDLWPGVTLVYDGGSGILESTFRIAPRKQKSEPGSAASPVDRIRLRYNVPVALDDNGELVLLFQTGQMRESAPVAWQVIDGKRVPVRAAFRILKNNEVGFRVGNYDPTVPLLIDPVLSWNTFMGSDDNDYSYAIAVDAAGNVYVAGSSRATWGTPVNAHTGMDEAFAVKFDSNGNRLWHTFMGSGSRDSGTAIAVDAAGNVYVSGNSPTTWGSPVNDHAGSGDAFAVKLDSNGNRLWHTFMGSGSSDSCSAIAVDAAGNVYLAGHSSATWGSPVDAYAGGFEAFAVKLDSSGNRLWHTFMGSGATDYSGEIAVDAGGSVYVSGQSWAAWGSPVNAHAGNNDAFAVKLDSSGNRLWHTFIGSGNYDYCHAIAVDAAGSVYLAGNSLPPSGTSDAYAVKLDSSGNQQWQTFMGSGDSDDAHAIALDAAGGVYVAGYSNATWGSPVNAYAGNTDAFAVKLDSSGNRQWHTFIGSEDNDHGEAIAVDAIGNVYLAGRSYATWSSPVNAHAGEYDAFAVKLLPSHSLTVNNIGTGSGTVTSSPDGIDCGSECATRFRLGSIVSLSATPDSGMVFGGWSVSGFTETDDCNVVMDADVAISAIFNDPAVDTDMDGLSDLDEQGPSFDNMAYDGNTDGFADWLQPDVMSCPSYDGSRYTTTALAGADMTGAVVVPVDAPAASLPEGVELSYGLYNLTVNSMFAGQNATVMMYLESGDTPDTYYKYGPTPSDPTDHWYEFLYDGETGAEINGSVITLHFVDGKRGDDDLDDSNGIITDPGGPAFNTVGDDDNGGSSGGGGSGCFIDTLE